MQLVTWNLRREMSIVEFKSRAEEGESARKTEEKLGEWSMKAIKEGNFKKERAVKVKYQKNETENRPLDLTIRISMFWD